MINCNEFYLKSFVILGFKPPCTPRTPFSLLNKLKNLEFMN